MVNISSSEKSKAYEALLQAAPDHDSTEFLDYLRANNKVVGENKDWLVIENYKYHTKKRPWYTAFAKGYINFSNLTELSEMYQQFDLLLKSPQRRTVTRFHLHLVSH